MSRTEELLTRVRKSIEREMTAKLPRLETMIEQFPSDVEIGRFISVNCEEDNLEYPYAVWIVVHDLPGHEPGEPYGIQVGEHRCAAAAAEAAVFHYERIRSMTVAELHAAGILDREMIWGALEIWRQKGEGEPTDD